MLVYQRVASSQQWKCYGNAKALGFPVELPGNNFLIHSGFSISMLLETQLVWFGNWSATCPGKRKTGSIYGIPWYPSIFPGLLVRKNMFDYLMRWWWFFRLWRVKWQIRIDFSGTVADFWPHPDSCQIMVYVGESISELRFPKVGVAPNHPW